VNLGFSVNLPLNVSQLDRLSGDEIKSLFEPASYRLARNHDEIKRDVSVGRVGIELYPYLMLLLAFVLAAEQLLGNRFYRDEKATSADAKTIAKSMVESQGSTAASERTGPQSAGKEAVLR
jgi:hypothetical protein